jgi:pimeloyl-ACP methyl ester carboxylesterase
VVGHSWGGHLALHLLLAHPDRLLGVVAVDPLGAFAGAFAEIDVRRRHTLSPGRMSGRTRSRLAAGPAR